MRHFFLKSGHSFRQNPPIILLRNAPMQTSPKVVCGTANEHTKATLKRLNCARKFANFRGKFKLKTIRLRGFLFLTHTGALGV